MSEAALPEKIVRQPGAGFADFTVTRRLPKILADVEPCLGKRGVVAEARALLAALRDGLAIETEIFARPTPFWARYLEALHGATWSSVPFFDLEFLFYHGLNSLSGHFSDGIDLFEESRRAAARAASVSHEATWLGLLHLDGARRSSAALLGALFANEADYSQLGVSIGGAEGWRDRIVHDQSGELLAETRALRADARIELLADNAGAELCSDLVWLDGVLEQHAAAKAVVHVKPWPMFVSDARVSDVALSIETLRASRAREVSLLGERLGRCLASGRLEVRTDAAWGEPRHFAELPGELGAELASADLVIAKGDLNYRRFVEDRSWPAHARLSQAAARVPFRAYCLRVLESEAVVGLGRERIAQVTAQDAAWRTSGRFAVVQCFDRRLL